MRTVLSLILLGAIGLQAMLGCCCRAALVFDMIAGATAQPVPACCCHPDEGTVPAHPPCQHCIDCGSIGEYITAPKTMLENPDTVLPCTTLAMASEPLKSGPGLAVRCEFNSQPTSDRPIYLLRQLFLL
jgi:hypothetical protein